MMAQTERRLFLAGREILLIGTAHISQESIEQVKKAITDEKPDCVAIELDEQRLQSMKNPDSWRNLDIVKVLKNNQGFVLMANLVLSSFQRRMGADVGVKPGEEMKAAVETAESLSIPAVMVDRPIQTTLRRAWAKNTLWGKCKLLAALVSSAFENEKISAEQIENLKNTNEMDSMMEELSEYLPKVKEVLIDERDAYLASHIWKADGKKVVAVLGAGHLPGVEKHLLGLAEGSESDDVSAISKIPSAGIGAKIAGLFFPLAIVGLIAAGFITGGADASLDMLINWVLWNGSLAALGTAAALGHPLAVIVGFAGAPLATLNPVLGIGLFTGLVQAVMRKPKVEDLENLTSDVSSLKGLYRNRLLRVLLVFFLSSFGGVAGNFIAVPTLIKSLL